MQLRGVNNAKFRKHVIPGDQLKLIVSLGAVRGPLVKVTAVAEVDGQTVMEATLLLAYVDQPGLERIDPSARVHADAVIGEGTSVGPFAVIGPGVRIGRNCKIGAYSIVEHTDDRRRHGGVSLCVDWPGAAGPEIPG